MSRSAGSFITAGPENLRCCACPNLPHFTNASHLLTHLCSKYHLKIIFELELRAKGDRKAAARLEEYHQWYDSFGVDRALAQRQKLKEEKVSSAAREREDDAIKAKKIKQEDNDFAQNILSLDPQLSKPANTLRISTRPSSMSLLTPASNVYQSIDPGLLQKTDTPDDYLSDFPKLEVDDSVNLFAQDRYYEDELYGLIKTEPDLDLDPQILGLPDEAALMMRTFRFRRGYPLPGVPRTGSDFFDGEEDPDTSEMKVKGKVWPGMKCYDWATPTLRARRLAANAQRKALDAIKTAEVAAEHMAAESAARQEQALYEDYVEETDVEEDGSYYEDVEVDSDATQSVEPQTPPPHSSSSSHLSSPDAEMSDFASSYDSTSYKQLTMGDNNTPPTFLFTPYFPTLSMDNGYSMPPAGFLQETLEQAHCQWQQSYHQQPAQQDLSNPYATPYSTNKRPYEMMNSHLSPLAEPPSKHATPSFAWCEPEDEVGIFGSPSLPAYQNVSRQPSFEEFFKYSETVQPSTTLEDKNAQYVDTLLELAVGAGVSSPKAQTTTPARKTPASKEAGSSRKPAAVSKGSTRGRGRPRKCPAQQPAKTTASTSLPATRPVTRSVIRKTKPVEIASRTPTESSLSSLTSIEDNDDDYFD
ncbi:hypothetical protein BJ508DRAFT_323170 [Ascobolus immersus RN42]|uniref:Uncharacterized protein n=1 Tax=Ascobolus immersus RN42 TaxID=1160509 RepID=A0A3N4IFP3_ASCIM|nr:hypothetical protein BJ508DRAFT_323170 [Ascobolus immersus RN42]